MMHVLFFAQVSELVGTDGLQVSAEYADVVALRRQLAENGDRWSLARGSGMLLAAVYQSLLS
ncbi:molybdopterin synthase sulfur carrier subunit, partial [Erwinia amylovora]|uniref:molybdopterin synthase sulfur carrier subunit n=1 Tax=Erwinia amylovora TaxID=552 RepID=UPI0020C0D7D9